MDRLNIKIDVSKIDKNKIITRSFNTIDGNTITVREISLDIVPRKEAKLLKDGDTYQLWKTHFVAIPQNKEERANKIKSVILGDGTMFKDKQPATNEADETVSESEIPF